MAVITIKDLPQSDELDREAMRSILGGGHIAPRPPQADSTRAVRRLVEYPPGFNRHGLVSKGTVRSK